MKIIEYADAWATRLTCGICVEQGVERPFTVPSLLTRRDSALFVMTLHHTIKHGQSPSEQRVANRPIAA
jgi:hypothetical protein